MKLYIEFILTSVTGVPKLAIPGLFKEILSQFILSQLWDSFNWWCTYLLINENRALKMKLFWYNEIFFVNFDFENGCKNEFQDNNKKSWSWFKNRVPQNIDFRAFGTPESNPTAWEVI